MAGLVAAPLLAYIAATDGNRLTACLAMFNLEIIGGLLYALFSMRALQTTPELLALPGLGISWPLTMLYFSIVYPDAYYSTLTNDVSCLRDGHLVQIALLIFVSAYALGVLPLFSWKLKSRSSLASGQGTPIRASRLESWLVLLGVASITIGWMANVVQVVGAGLFVANALRNYFTGFLFVGGSRWQGLKSWMKWTILIGLGACVTVNSIANARGLAIGPVVIMALGYLVSSSPSRRSKQLIVISALVSFPLYSVLGNQTRLSLHSVGFENFEHRVSAYVDVVSTGLQTEQGGVLDEAILRQFSTGGHALITNDWALASFDNVNVWTTIKWFVRNLLPNFLGGPDASEGANRVLIDYGFMITDKTSVEVSMVGALFHEGGLLSVAIGGFCLGLFHLLLSFAIRARWGGTAGQQVILSAICVPLMAGYTLDELTHVRTTLWSIVYCVVAFFVLKLAEQTTRPRDWRFMAASPVPPQSRAR